MPQEVAASKDREESGVEVRIPSGRRNKNLSEMQHNKSFKARVRQGVGWVEVADL
jgi:hypothetical protein